MWIIPSNLQVPLVTAQDCAASKEELNERLAQSEPLFMWKSKPLLLKTFWPAWKRVYWLRHLSGRILKPSMQDHFVTKYTESLEDIPANHSATPVSEKEKPTHDTFTHIWSEISRQLDLFGSSSKTSAGIYHLDSTRFTEAFQKWVTQLRQESLRRRKLALHTRERDCSYLQFVKSTWPTPTPTSDEANNTTRSSGVFQSLTRMIQQWPTPQSRDYKQDGNHNQENNRPLSEAVNMKTFGRQDQGNRNIHGKNREQLNPAWEAQLMGTTLEKTFFVPMVTV